MTFRILVLLFSFCTLAQGVVQAQLEDQNGNIMVGSGQAKGKLHIRSTQPTSNPQFYLDENQGKLGLKIWQEAPPTRNVHFNLSTHDNANGDLVFGVKNYSASIHFETGSSTTYQRRMTINKYGDVVIGPGQAKGKLHVRSNGSSNNPQFYLDENQGKLGLKIWQEAPPTRNVHFNLSTHDNANGDLIFGVKNFSASIHFETGTSTTYQRRMTINKFGNVIIGSPNAINNAYKLNVGGSIRANEVVINTTGADYVFESDYHLRPLHKVEDFINENGHLPGIIPAARMQKDGIQLGEFNMLLLEKIEELTIYLIQKDKEISELKSEIEKIKTHH